MSNTLLDILLPDILPEPIAASDGTLYRTAGQALLHDLIEAKWRELLPTLEKGQVVRETRLQLHVTQSELARESGISQPLLAMLEAGHRRMTEENIWKVWSALWRRDHARKACTTPEILIRLEDGCAVATQILCP